MQKIKNKDQYVQNVFNAIAEKYDWMNLLMTWGMLIRWQNFVLKKTGLVPGDKALDVCCGTGELTKKTAQLVGPTGHVWGLDFAQNMLRIAEAKTENVKKNNITFLHGDALSLPFLENSFDSAINCFALRNVLDIPQAIKEMTRVVRPGGTVLCLEVSQPTNIFFKIGFNLYYFKIVPLLGKIIGRGQPIDGLLPAYTWLAESLKDFPHPNEIKTIFQDMGLKNVEFYPLSFGAVTVYRGYK